MKKLISCSLFFVLFACASSAIAVTGDDFKIFRGMKYTMDSPSEIHKFRIENDLATRGCHSNLIIFKAGEVWWIGLLGEGENFYSSTNFQSGATKSVAEVLQSGITTVDDVVTILSNLDQDFSDPMYMRDFLKFMTFC